MRAITYATGKHDGQRRKVDDLPYIAHPYRVAMLLKDYNCPNHVVIAGLLHDIVEDTNGTFTELTNLFGDEVTTLVRYVTELDKNKSWEERKQHSIDKIKHAPLEAKLITCADKVDNLQSILDGEIMHGPSMWFQFSRGKADQQWYYQKMYKSVIYGLDDDPHPLMTLFKQLVDQLMLEN